MGKTTWIVRPGDVFGRGTVIEEIRLPGNGKHKTMRGVRLQCSCGTIYETRLQDLVPTSTHPTQSCGCLMRETASVTMRRPEHLTRLAGYNEAKRGQKAPVVPRTKSRRMTGHRNHPLYGTWSNMMSRCYNPNVKSYRDYGARGIVVCERWKDPRNFIEDIELLIGPRPPGMTLDRRNNDGPYVWWNVRWADRVTQARNSRRCLPWADG